MHHVNDETGYCIARSKTVVKTVFQILVGCKRLENVLEAFFVDAQKISRRQWI